MAKQNSPLVLGTEPIGKLLTQYAIPAIIAMTASSLYNMADSIFIGHGVGALAISGLALTFPLMNLAAAFGSLVGVGASTLVDVKLGQKDYEGANKVLGNVLILNVVLGVAFTIAFLFLLDPVLYFFGASENTISYARDYMRIILYGNVVTHMYLRFIDRAADRISEYLCGSTVREFEEKHGMPIRNEHETFYTLIVGLISLIRLHPDIDDDIVRQVAAQTLHLDEYL